MQKKCFFYAQKHMYDREKLKIIVYAVGGGLVVRTSNLRDYPKTYVKRPC